MVGRTGHWAATVRQRLVRIQPVKPLRVFEQGNRAVERTTLVGRAHRLRTYSILVVMPELYPSNPNRWSFRLQDDRPCFEGQPMKPRRLPVTLITATMLTLSACTTGTTQPAGSQPKDATEAPSPAEALSGPDVGVAYTYDLPAHCRPIYAAFGGRLWKVEQPVPDPPGEPFARGSVDYLPGTMQLTAPDQLRFTVDTTSPVIPDAVVMFRPTTESPPLCH